MLFDIPSQWVRLAIWSAVFSYLIGRLKLLLIVFSVLPGAPKRFHSAGAPWMEQRSGNRLFGDHNVVPNCDPMGLPAVAALLRKVRRVEKGK